jgi:hypothetical protein
MWQHSSRLSYARRWQLFQPLVPSSPVAIGKVVIMANEPGLTKSIMSERIKQIFEERGVEEEGNRVGWDFICRVGDPTCVNDLMRVSATSATAIVAMMTSEDVRQHEESSGDVINGATIRTLLALRYTFSKINEDFLPHASDILIK